MHERCESVLVSGLPGPQGAAPAKPDKLKPIVKPVQDGALTGFGRAGVRLQLR
jgi:hypothetical protein